MKICVTGCGGFLGAEIVRQLLDRGDKVIGLGRRDYPQLARRGMQLARGDVRNQSEVIAACTGVDAVIHTAAIAGVWGSFQHYHQTNTVGTENIVKACQDLAIGTLVLCSSPSVTFGGADQSGVDESEPYPTRYLCHYPRTKAAAEKFVLAAHRPGTLATCALRPHLIWSADDPHLFPRLIQKAQSGRLRRVGSGNNLIDTIHVRNAAHAHVLAVDKLSGSSDSDAGGRAYFLSQDEPIACWDWLSQILSIARTKVPRKSISYPAAYALGSTLEAIYHAGRIKTEPPMTRFVAAQLAKDHYFDISAARRLLGYTPQVSTQEGIAELERAWAK